MKNLKIRWFDKSSGEFICTDTLDKELMHYFSVVDGKLKLFVEGMDCDVTGMRYDEVESEPMLFTGYKDSDGNEIFEGDILQFDYIAPEENPTGIGVVYYCDKTACFRVKDNLGDKDLLEDTGGVIVGNSDMNPEYIEIIDQLLKYHPKQCA